jgi:hypothetical protein
MLTTPLRPPSGGARYNALSRQLPTRCLANSDVARLQARALTCGHGASRDRTGDLLLAKQALSQLSYGPSAVDVNPGVDRPGDDRTATFGMLERPLEPSR